MAELARGCAVLDGRYTLLETPLSVDATSQCWTAADPYGQFYLAKLWPFRGDSPEDFQRALWDQELRMLYRVGSSPGAEETILVIRDAGVDKDVRCFVVIMELRGASGYIRLSDALVRRAQFDWLTARDAQTRLELWRALQRIADGLRLLHEQDILHRQVGADSVFFDPNQGSRTLRLGGFEWSIRLGVAHSASPPHTWATPPEFAATSTGYRSEVDWYGFGMLAIRCLLPLEALASLDPITRSNRVDAELNRNGNRLSDRERDFLRRMIARDPRDRLSRGYEIRTEMLDIIAALEAGCDPDRDDRPLVLAINPKSDLADAAVQAGFCPNQSKPHDPFNPADIQHVAALKDFLRTDFRDAQAYVIQDQKSYVLVGARMCLIISPFKWVDQSEGTSVETWELAYCRGVGELRRNDAVADLPSGRIAVCTAREAYVDRTLRQKGRDWRRFLPTLDRSAELKISLSRFHDFLRYTNQIELLLCDAEIFRYQIVASESRQGLERIAIKEIARPRPVLPFIRVEGGLTEFLQRERESGKPECNFVVLTNDDEDALKIAWRPPTERWEVDEIDSAEARVWLTRSNVSNPAPPPPPRGYVRAFGMFGQVSLIERRKKAIDRLQTHSYLLRSLSAPGQVYMDTGHCELPVSLPSSVVDEAKQAAMRDILRVRPIYALQGPPGTGKTTLVAHLLRQFFAADPVAQILITAQAHGAVDVLRRKVRDEAFRDVPEASQPLAVRLGKRSESRLEEGSIEEVALRILRAADAYLLSVETPTDLQSDWKRHVQQMGAAIESGTYDAGVRDFIELVRRGASLTYCTTSAGDLEELADEVQFFDWSIVEESGKAHGFDLALPLQAGHRWLLIGDHDQLPPYRVKDYHDGIDLLEQALAALRSLPERGGNLVDVELLNSLGDQTPDERAQFQEYCRSWIKTFARVFGFCTMVQGVERVTLDGAVGAAAGILSQQYRMHPTIGTLISEAYYDGRLKNMTADADGCPHPDVVHPLVRPDGISGKAILWIDTPWSSKAVVAEEHGPQQGRPRYSNPAEVQAIADFLSLMRRPGSISALAADAPALSLTVLSPYNQQVSLINRTMRRPELPDGIVLRAGLRTRRGAQDAPTRLAHTVDSFQGNEADIIIVSLVRNNSLLQGAGLGFLQEAPRLNVLLSRAERLLVLVGSWEFFQYQVSTVQLDNRYATLWHLRKVMALLEQWVADGKMLRIAASALASGAAR